MAATKRKKREDRPSRFRKARGDASIATIQRTLEDKFGLPGGSVKLVYPTGRKARSDSKVELLIKSWDKKD
jgi:hypothetical protein